jgi:hypothetical protein
MFAQCTTLIAKQDFKFRGNAKGRACVVKCGQKFWITNSMLDQRNGFVMINREGKGCISNGYAFTVDMINQLFVLVA